MPDETREEFSGRPVLTIRPLRATCTESVTTALINGTLLVKIISTLPLQIAQEILERLIHDPRMDDPVRFKIFIKSLSKDEGQMQLQNLNFRNSIHITDKNLSTLLKRYPLVKHVEIRGCPNLTSKCISAINGWRSLESLSIDTVHPHLLPRQLKCLKLKSLRVSVSNCTPPQLIKKIYTLLNPHFLTHFLDPVIKNLTHLDLSGCSMDIHFKALKEAGQLRTLILNDVSGIQDILQDILELGKLRVLDISVSFGGNSKGRFSNPEEIVFKILESLPELEELDISGTNLINSYPGNAYGIPESRMNKPLEFLGLFRHEVDPEVLTRADIPTITVSGNSNESQRIMALKKNIDRPKMLASVLPKFLETSGIPDQEGRNRLSLFCKILGNHTLPGDIKGTALECLWKVLIDLPQISLDFEVKQEISRALFWVMRVNYLNLKVIETSYKVLIEILGCSQDNEFYLKEFAKILMNIDTQSMNFDIFEFLCKLRGLLADRDNPELIEYLCDLKIIEKSLAFVGPLHFQYQGDSRTPFYPSVLLIWSTLGKIVKKSLEGRKRFLKADGLHYLRWFLAWYPHQFQLSKTLREIFYVMDKSEEVFKVEENLSFRSHRKEVKKVKKNVKCRKAIKDLLARRDSSVSAHKNSH